MQYSVEHTVKHVPCRGIMETGTVGQTAELPQTGNFSKILKFINYFLIIIIRIIIIIIIIN